jgi:hypothetical protein
MLRPAYVLTPTQIAGVAGKDIDESALFANADACIVATLYFD